MTRLRRAFTLVELLAALGIVVVLAALALPALNKARQRTGLSACAANLRSLGHVLLLYPADNDGMLPTPIAASGSNYWRYQILPYLDLDPANSDNVNRTPFLCPAVARLIVQNGGGGRSGRIRGSNLGIPCFSMNYFLAAAGSGGKQSIRLGAVGAPARVMMAMDGCLPARSAVPNSYVLNSDLPNFPLYHQGAKNLLFVDGHVETWPDGSVLNQLPYKPGGVDDVWTAR